jgi:hypothetical protein
MKRLEPLAAAVAGCAMRCSRCAQQAHRPVGKGPGYLIDVQDGRELESSTTTASAQALLPDMQATPGEVDWIPSIASNDSRRGRPGAGAP